MTGPNNEAAASPRAQRGGRRKSAENRTVPADVFRQIPPHSIEAEQAVLGGVLINPDILNSLVEFLAAEDFYLPAHQAVYGAFLDLAGEVVPVPIDIATVSEHLKKHGRLEGVGGAPYIGELAHSSISTANVEYFAGIVRDRALSRALIGSCSDIIGRCHDPSAEVDALLDEAEQAVFSIANRRTGQTVRSLKDLLPEVIGDLTKRINRNEMMTGVPTEYRQLDLLTAGLQPSDLIIVAARPGMGKTAFALNLALRAAVWRNVPVAIFSLEMSTNQLTQRMICAWGKIDLGRVRNSCLDASDIQNLHAAHNALAAVPIFIDDSSPLNPLQLRARARRLKSQHNIGMVIVDYLQLMHSPRKWDSSREQEISEISRNLKALAKELNVPVIALSQLNRKIEDRSKGERRPQLSDLRESGAIEQDADLIMFIHNEAELLRKGEKRSRPPSDEVEIIIGKQRNGPTGEVKLMYIYRYTSFEEIAMHTPPENM